MIKTTTVQLVYDETTEIAQGVTVRFIENKRQHLPDAIICTAGKELREPAFAGLILSEQAKRFVPYFQVVRWSESTILIGLWKLLAIDAQTGQLRSEVVLNRSVEDDRGFYHMQWIEAAGLILCIYEGGIVAFETVGTIRWHQTKSWNDLFDRCTGEQIEFVDDNDKHLTFDLATGSRL